MAGQAQAAKHNNKILVEQAHMEHAAQEREFLVETNAANKDAYGAKMEADRGAAFIRAQAKGQGSTMGLRIGEQHRQGALSIANARDRTEAAHANYIGAGMNTTIGTRNRIKANRISPMTAFANIATAGISNYGAFR